MRLLEGREVDAPAETVSFEAVGCLAECLEVDAITPRCSPFGPQARTAFKCRASRRADMGSGRVT